MTVDAIPFESVISTPELRRRPSRPPDYAAENRALVELASHLATSPADILQKLAEVTLRLCNADSAGISLVEQAEGRLIFRWPAIAGRFAANVRGTTPREFSPCGVVVDTDAVQLFDRPGRHYVYLDEVTPRIVEALLQPFHFEGKPIGTIWAMANDATRKFDAEDARALGSLATFTSGAYQVLVALQTARDADQRKDDFLAVLSHEMRSPLNAVLTWSHALRSGAVSDETREQAYAGIERSARSQARMIDDLLDSARIIAGKVSLDPQDVDLRTIVREAADAARAVATEAGLALEVVAGIEPLPVRVDVVRTHQVVGNLLSNAVKFTAAGGTVRVASRRSGAFAEVTVTDTGAGIPAGLLPRIFDRFRQGDTSMTRQHGGLGLGLSIARHLLTLQGGTIEAQSDGSGHGATFRVRLPLAARATEARIPAHSAADLGPSLDGARILVVDDDAETCLALEALLVAAGARVTTAASAHAALQCYARSPADVVITDLAMPGEDGYTLLRELRAGGATAVPVLAVTGAATAEGRRQVKEAGFTLHLTKPVEPRDIQAAVAMALTGAADTFAAQRSAD